MKPAASVQTISLSPENGRKEARDQLTLILGFFARVDAKASALLAINTGMLAVLASNAAVVADLNIWICLSAGLTIFLIAGSLWFLYRVAFPALSGGHQSLIYFREIAQRTESNFIDDFTAQDDTGRTKDLLGQVWRNSCILSAKFDSLKVAFILMALAILPWAAAVALLSSLHPALHSLPTK